MFGIKVLEKRKSKHNGTVCVVRSVGNGTYLQVDGLTQSGGVVESIWKSTLIKVRKEKKEVRDILILGLGGGTAAKVCRKIWPDSKIQGIEIDPVMIDLGVKYLKLDRSKIKVVITDAYKWLTANSQNRAAKYDLILVDLYQGYDVPNQFSSASFINDVKILCKNSGIAVFNRLYFDDKRKLAIKFAEMLEKVFQKVYYHYPQANLAVICIN